MHCLGTIPQQVFAESGGYIYKLAVAQLLYINNCVLIPFKDTVHMRGLRVQVNLLLAEPEFQVNLQSVEERVNS